MKKIMINKDQSINADIGIIILISSSEQNIIFIKDVENDGQVCTLTQFFIPGNKEQ